MNRNRIRQATIILAGTMLIWAFSNASAESKWYTARTVNGRTQPLSAGTETITMPNGRTVGIESATISEGLIDLVISLYNDPKGDDNGNTQDVDPDSVSQDAYEKIIQYFADGVYEATEGVHSLRNVRIYRGGLRQDADVIWKVSEHPNANNLNQQGITARIAFGDIFGTLNFTNSAAEQEKGGYTLAHEFGHYFYSLKDEYCRWNNAWVNLAANQKTQPCIMNSQWNAYPRTYTWLNNSIRYNTNAAAGSPYVDYECRSQTAQYQFYGDGAWPVLARNPTGDPLDTALRQAIRAQRGMRIHYPELAAVAPSAMNAPRIDLSAATPLKDLASRSNLNIIWMGSNIVVEIIIDESGSMSGSPLTSAKGAAKLLVDQVSDGSAVGVIGFDDSVYTIAPITIVTSATMRASIKTAIDSSSGGGWTAIGDAALSGLNQILAFGHTNFTRVAFLLSDGDSNTGSDPMAAAARYQTAQIPIMAFGYGYSSSTLAAMAGLTGGSYYDSPATMAEISAAFQNAFATVSARQNLADGFMMATSTSTVAASASAQGAVSIPFQVDATIADLNVTVTYSSTNTVTLNLKDPTGVVYSAVSTNISGIERMLSFSVSAPTTGQWKVTGTAPTDCSLRYQVNAGVNGFTYNLTAVSMDGTTVSYPTPIKIVASLNQGQAVNGAVVKAIITDEATNTTTLTLANTDVGTYSAVFMPTNDAVFNIVISADNSANAAAYTYSGIDPSADENGDLVPLPADAPLNVAFTRTTSLQVTMTGTDYASVPAAPSYATASEGDYTDRVIVTWPSAYGASVYEIWRSTTDSIGSASKLAEVDSSFTSYVDESVSLRAEYYYWVRGVNFKGSGEFTSSAKGWVLFGPDIKANGENSLSVYSGDSVNVSVRLNIGSFAGTVCDWFIIVMAQNGSLYYMNGNGQWVQAYSLNSIRAVATLGLFDISNPFTVFSSSALPTGTYTFFFALDAYPSGYLDPYCTVYDKAVVQVYY